MPLRAIALHKRTAIALAATALLAIAGAGAAVHANSGTNDGPTSYAQDPNIVAACAQAHVSICNPAGWSYLQAHAPWSLPPSANPTFISRAQAILTAREYGATARTPEAPASSPVYARLVTRAQYMDLLPSANVNLTADQRRLVWVVTVHADTATDGSLISPGVIKPVYTVVIDAASGWITDACRGCAALSSD